MVEKEFYFYTQGFRLEILQDVSVKEDVTGGGPGNRPSSHSTTVSAVPSSPTANQDPSLRWRQSPPV